MRKIFAIVIIISIITLTAAGVYLFIDSYNFKIQMAEKDKELKSRISQAREAIKKELMEAYRTSTEAYEDTYKKLEAEKNKVRGMERKVEKIGTVPKAATPQ